MATYITFEAHSTTLDNEAGLSSGWNDVELSPLGIQQAQELGQRYQNRSFDAIFCSDLQRSYKTAEIAFANRNFTIIQDKRLRECHYGDLTQHPSKEVEEQKLARINTPFPNGESYQQTTQRMKEFLADLITPYHNQHIMIIGHRATQYGIEHTIHGTPLEQLVTATFKWQPGWDYTLEYIK